MHRSRRSLLIFKIPPSMGSADLVRIGFWVQEVGTRSTFCPLGLGHVSLKERLKAGVLQGPQDWVGLPHFCLTWEALQAQPTGWGPCVPRLWEEHRLRRVSAACPAWVVPAQRDRSSPRSLGRRKRGTGDLKSPQHQQGTKRRRVRLE